MTDQSPTIGQQAAAANRQAEPVGFAGSVAATCPRTALEIGVFFDGTGNNEVNVGLGPNFSSDASYASARSNVSLLKDLYKDSKDRDWEQDASGYCRKFAAIYMSGIGTTDREGDDTIGSAMGKGSTGVESRVFEACVKVGTEINRLSPGAEPTEIVLDVFGFSRGAAAARYFVNCFRQGFVRYNALDWSFWRGVHFDRNEASVPEGRNVRIRFVGIFDTVAAIGLGGNDYGDVNVHLSTAQADRIYHLTASNEYRAKFSLDHNVPDGGDTRALIGAHSDVGGGYGEGVENQLVEREDTETFTDRSRAEAAHAAARAAAANPYVGPNSHWVRDGWIEEGNPDGAYRVEVSPIRAVAPMTFGLPSSVILYSFSKRTMIRRDVSAGLSRIPLRIMYDAAFAAGVPFRVYPSENDLYKPPDDFPEGAADTMIAGGSPPVEVRHDILRRFGHISARFDTITGEHEGLAERWDTFTEGLAHSPGDDWKRTIYWNEVGRAK